MIRVLHVMGSLECGGQEMTIMNFYRAMNKNKIQFDFLITTQGEDYFEEEAISLGARVFRREMRSKHPFQNAIQLFVVLKSHPEIQAVHIHNFSPIIAIDTFIAMCCGVPIRIAHSHNVIEDMPRVQKMFRPLLRATATHYFDCATMAGISLFGEKALSRLTLIPNARDLSTFYFDPQVRMQVRKELKLEDQFVLLNVGRLETQKNQTFLLTLFAQTAVAVPKAVLLLAGDGVLKKSLVQQAKDLGLEGKIRFLGHYDKVNQLLQGADVFVLPSLHEGLPGSVIEAQAAGLSCLLADTITSEADITGRVQFIPIDQGPTPWVERISAIYSQQIDRDIREIIEKSGYEIKDAAHKLETLYEDSLKNGK